MYITNATNTKQGGNSPNQTHGSAHVENNDEDNLQLQATLLQPYGVKNIEQDLALCKRAI